MLDMIRRVLAFGKHLVSGVNRSSGGVPGHVVRLVSKESGGAD